MTGVRWWRLSVCAATVLAGCGAKLSGQAIGAICGDDGGLSAGGGPENFGVNGGTFSSPDLEAVICRNGAFAYLEPLGSSSLPNQFLMVVDGSFYGGAASPFQVQKPANASSGQLGVNVQLGGASPGVYRNGDTCGQMSISVTPPIPSSVNCASDAAGSSVCPPGCVLTGPIGGNLVCMPLTQQISYQANTASDCMGGSVVAEGSWTLTLTSVAAPTSVVDSRSAIHGTLSAKLLGGTADAGLAEGVLWLEF
jgi:hypothetical protein